MCQSRKAITPAHLVVADTDCSGFNTVLLNTFHFDREATNGQTAFMRWSFTHKLPFWPQHVEATHRREALGTHKKHTKRDQKWIIQSKIFDTKNPFFYCHSNSSISASAIWYNIVWPLNWNYIYMLIARLKQWWKGIDKRGQWPRCQSKIDNRQLALKRLINHSWYFVSWFDCSRVDAFVCCILWRYAIQDAPINQIDARWTFFVSSSNYGRTILLQSLV